MCSTHTQCLGALYMPFHLILPLSCGKDAVLILHLRQLTERLTWIHAQCLQYKAEVGRPVRTPLQ